MKPSTQSGRPGRFTLSVLAALLAAAWLAPAWAADAPGAASPEVQKGIAAVMQAKVDALYSEKNARGESYKRGYYSRIFRRVDDSTYSVSFKVDTAFDERMVAERFTDTLKKQADGSWKVADEKLEDSYTGMYRYILGQRDCFAFDAFKFQREGLTITSGKGSMCQGSINGKPGYMGVTGENLKYSYEAPVVDKEWLYKLMSKEKAPDLVFTPKYVGFQCDPVSCEDIRVKSFTATRTADEKDVDPRLKDAGQERDNDDRKGRSESAFYGFVRPYETGRTQWSVGIRRDGPTEHWLYMDYDSYEPKEVSVGASGYGPLYRYYGEQTRASGIDPYQLEYRPDSNALDFDMTSVQGEVELGFGTGESLSGDVTFGLKTKRGLREIPFGISRNREAGEDRETKNPRMTINTLQDGDGNDLTWVRTGLYSGLIVLPKAVPAGTPLSIRLQFENKDSIYKLTPTFSSVDRGGWLPFIRFGDMIDTFDLTIHVPSRYTTLGIGRKVSEAVKDGVSTTRWVADSPVTFPTIIYGIYESEKPSFQAKKLDGTPIDVTMYVDKDSMNLWELPPKSLRKFADDAANALNLYSRIYGVDYPYSKLDLVNDFVPRFYGQAPSSIIYLGSAAFNSKGMVASFSGGSSTRITEFLDSLVAHETAHQWWGSVIANSNFYNYWFVESIAEYSAALFLENVYGKAKYEEKVESWRKEILDNDIRSGVQDSYTVWAGPGGFGPYRANLYAKGPYAFHIMRSTWGDEAFFKFLKNLAQELKGKEIVTRDIQKVAEKSFGANMDWFFDQWVRGTGLPEFTFTYNVRPAEDGQQYVIEGEITQRILMKAAMSVKEEVAGQYFKGMIPITVIGKSGKEYRKKVLIENAKVAFKFNVPEKPKEVVFNKHGESLGYDVKVVESSSM